QALYHRLAGLILLIPPWRERVEDLPGLIAAELDIQARSVGKKLTAIHPAAMDLLLHYHWPGNLRELHHTIRTVVLFCDTKEVQPEHVVFQPALSAAEGGAEKSPDNGVFSARGPIVPATANGDDLSLGAALRRHVRAVYQRTGDNQRQAAR